MQLFSLRRVLYCGTSLALGLIALQAVDAMAQDATPAQNATQTVDAQPADATAKPAGEKKNADTGSTEVVVTGTRIRNRSAAAATPTEVIDSKQIKQSGTREIADLVNELPQLVISQSDQTSNANHDKDSMDYQQPGLNALDLRGLGIKRTLTLVDGRRHVPGAPGTSAVDVSTLPAGLIDRVEVITGGASALYGADAVAGVANFILKKNYDGFESTIQYGNSTYWDMPTYDLSILYGKNFDHGRGNFTLYGSYSGSPGMVTGADRPSTAGGYPAWETVGLVTGNPNFILDGRHDLYNAQYANVLLGGKVWTFNTDGTLRAPQLGPSGILPTTDDLSQSSSISTLQTDGGEYGGRYDGWLLSVPSKRYTLHASLDYKLNDSVSYFLQLDYATNRNVSESAFLTEFGTNPLDPANPYITDQMRAANGGSITDPLYFVRRYQELGNSTSIYERQMSQVVTGFDGSLPGLLWGHDWTWSAYYSYGKTAETNQDLNQSSYTRYLNALDAVTGPGGTVECRVKLTDPNDPCVPLNPFKPLTADVIKYLQFNTDPAHSSLQQHVVSAYATGGLFNLPAGEVDLVLGGEYRKEIQDIGAVPQYDPNSPSYVADDGVVQNPLHGVYDVKEIFSELNVPILADLPLANKLSLDAAVRLSDYSTAGRTTSYKYGLQWAPVKDLRFRATYGVAVRAPDISEAFTATSVQNSYLSDPCNYYNLPHRTTNTQYTAANCAAIGQPANVNTYWLWTEIDKQGNPNLHVETGKTLTVGAVLQPRVMKNFSLSADYYHIDLTNVVSTVDPQTILDQCVDAPTLNNNYCSLVVRDPTTHNLVAVIDKNVNLAQRLTAGVDFNLTYFVDLKAWGWGERSGRLGVDSTYTRLFYNTYTADPSDPTNIVKTIGVFGFPKWKGVTRFTYQNGPLNVGWSVRHFSPMKGDPTFTEALYTPYDTKDVFYHDLNASYNLPRYHVSITAGFNNLLNTAPPRYPGAEAGGNYFSDTGWEGGMFDVIGRTGFISLTYKR